MSLIGRNPEAIFSIATADAERRERIAKICAYYGISTFWATGMMFDEIEWFEEKIKREKANAGQDRGVAGNRT